MPPGRIVWERGEVRADGKSISLGATFPGEIDGRKFQLLEAIVSDTGTYKFLLAPTLAFDSPSDQAVPELTFQFDLHPGTAAKVNFKFTYYTSGQGCPDEKFVYEVNANEGLMNPDSAGRQP